jgi:flagella basal body P-ring formation protein FlgA
VASTSGRVLKLTLFISAVIVVMFVLIDRAIKETANPIESFVAARDIPAGVYLLPDMVKKQRYPAYMSRPGALADLQEVSGLKTRIPIFEGQRIVFTQFEPSEKAQMPAAGL